jgi:hypothetical protein
MAKPKDFQLFWLAIIGIGFWLAVWEHEAVLKFAHTVYQGAWMNRLLPRR